uniref:Uncharacterized protein n=1 Tax=Bombyx mori TaxID=7091 RepID=A0A8R2AF65_BOMMO|nr:uncharacterized protein LOC101737383 [Bombyx mori]
MHFFTKYLIFLWHVRSNVGFYVPFSTSELTDEDSAILAENYGLLSNQMKSTTLKTRFAKSEQTLFTSNNMGLLSEDLDETPLREHATDKPNNLKERAFVYLNQKYKTPFQNQVYDLHMQAMDIPLRNYKYWAKSRFSKFVEFPVKMASFFQPSLYQIVDPEAKQRDFYGGATNENDNKMKMKTTVTDHNNAPNVNVEDLERQRIPLELLSKPHARKPNKYSPKNYELTDYKENKIYVDNLFKTIPSVSLYQTQRPIDEYEKLNERTSPRGGNSNFDIDEKQIRNSDIITYKSQFVPNTNQDYSNDQSHIKVFFNNEDLNSKFSFGNRNCNEPDCVPDENFHGKHYSNAQVPHKLDCNCNHKNNDDHKKSKERLERDKQQTQETIMTGHKCQNHVHETQTEDIIENELQNSVNILNRTLQMYF